MRSASSSVSRPLFGGFCGGSQCTLDALFERFARAAFVYELDKKLFVAPFYKMTEDWGHVRNLRV